MDAPYAGSSAELVGIREGDIIVSFDGVPGNVVSVGVSVSD
ncbi:MAG: PDZ domain-containing protein [Actinomycetota bacterium]